MIMDSSVPHKVPAISTSEDSHEIQPPSSDYRSNETTPRAAVIDDESRDMGETRRDQLLEKPVAVQDRDDTTTHNHDIGLGDAATAQMNGDDENTPDSGETDGTGESLTVNEKEDDIQNTQERVMPIDHLSFEPLDKAEAPSTHAARTANEVNRALPRSPSTSFDHAMDGQPWSHFFNPNDGSPARERPSKPHHRRSPATTSQSPVPSPNTKQSEYGDDEASFNLFNESFDIMSDTATYLRELHQGESNGNRGNDDISPSLSMLGLRDRHHHRRHGSTPHFDISLPALGHAEYAIEDVSPIRVHGEEHEGNTSHKHFLSGMEPIPVHFPTETDEDTVHHAHGQRCFSDHSPRTNAYGGSLVSNPYFVLRCARKAFAKCTFLFSCLDAPDPCAVNISEHGSFHHYQARENLAYYESTLSPQDINIAALRVGSAICAFGGSIKPQRVPRKCASIFRPKGASLDESNYARAPMSGMAYGEGLRNRYFLSGNHISWEIEENPPVELSEDGHSRRNFIVNMNTSSGSYATTGIVGSSLSNQSAERSKWSSTNTLSPALSSVVEMSSSGTEPPKMKYRCKLCGQPKQNHNCHYRQSMQRSIGITVHAAVNSYTAHEPGELTPALSEMNNFISYDSDHGESEYPKAASLPLTMPRHHRSHTSITPETSFQSAGALLSPQSSLSTRTPSPETTSLTHRQTDPRNSTGRADGNCTSTLKRSHSEMEAETACSAFSPFIEVVPLRPEQYRAVTSSKTPEGAFQYPAVPLSYIERKKLVDTLFVLCRHIPNLTDECSSILCDARMRGMWDLAVAEMLAQLLVGIYCQEGDRRLDGLQQYLLYLGISC